ncbi:CBS domain-containing protein [Nitrososphaera sp.]|uniref:CBS domain-containing protein n=1 Tax=Nitrososphaera sp. TaxID=1971748 RepID=UPI00307EF50B
MPLMSQDSEQNRSSALSKSDDKARKKEAIASYYNHSDLSAEAIAWQLDMRLDEVQKAIDELAKDEALALLAGQATTRIDKIMTPHVASLESSKTALDAAVMMSEKRISSIVVTKNGLPFGIVTERDIVRKVDARNRSPQDIKLEDIASHPLIVAEPGLTVEEAADLMTKNRIHKLPIVSAAGELLGMVTITDLAAFLSPSRRPGLALSVLQAISRRQND